ncbi:MAG: NAD(P)-dependent oxidoreductase [Gammaproteobacteria bacterium]|nr:NAD(P)-dependent oxidoreductase [Gammaproteobacteria bacterium]
MRIALFGASGQLGKAIKVVSSNSGQEFSDEIQIESMSRSDVRVDHDFLYQRLVEVKCDAVINCAAWTDVDAAESRAREVWSVNAEYPRALSQATARMRIPLVHISTEAVFSGLERQMPYTEADAPDPLTEYARSKRAGEVAVLEASAFAIVMRTSWLYAADATVNFPNRLKSQLTSGKSPVSVVTDVIGNPTPAPILATAILKSLRVDLPADLYHVACGGSVSKHDWALHLCELWGFAPDRVKPTTTGDYLSVAKRSLAVSLDSSKYLATGVYELPTWEDASSEYWASAAASARG